MFPGIEHQVIDEILDINQGNVEKSIDDLLDLNDPDPFAAHSLNALRQNSQERSDEILARILQDEQFAREISRHEDLRREIYGSKVFLMLIENRIPLLIYSGQTIQRCFINHRKELFHQP
jgi:hypothetical protein